MSDSDIQCARTRSCNEIDRKEKRMKISTDSIIIIISAFGYE